MTEFIEDPIVPLSLKVSSNRTYVTLYHPGWYSLEEDEDSQAFIGVPGRMVYGFSDLRGLEAYVRDGDISGLAPGGDLDAVRSWSAGDFEERLCAYDLDQLPELVDGELSSDEQGAFGSTLALGLDLLDFLEIEGEHADVLRDDDDISKLAAGDEVLSVFAPGRHRRHVVELVEAHWGWCVNEIARRITTPS